MSLLALKDLSVTLGTPLFAGLDLTLDKSDRLGLVAANGRGKSTLLSLLAEGGEPTSGQITRARGLATALMPQHVPDALRDLDAHGAACSGLADDSESWRVDIAFEDLQVPQDLWTRPVRELSGGWQRMILLARAVVAEPDVILMDEPTNHLDMTRIGQLELFIAALARDTAIVIASHDRAFLDAVTTRTLFLRPDTSPGFALPFSAARRALDERDAAEGRRFENEMRRAAQLRRQAAKLKNIGINSGSDLLITKTRQLTDRADKMEEAARPAHKEQGAGAIKLANSGSHAKALVSIEETRIAAPDDGQLFRTPRLWIERGDRVVLLGPNGAGKSRFLAAVRAAIADSHPTIRAAPSLSLGESDQGLTQLDRFETPLQAVTHSHDGGDQRARGLLAGAGLRIDLQTAPIRALSGGQRARLAMLLLRLARPNFYLLDEPTNHLDIDGQEALEDELLAQGATTLFTSHDRAFVRAVASRVWVIDGRRLTEVADPDPVFDALMSA